MMTFSFPRTAAFAVGALALGACSDSLTEPQATPEATAVPATAEFATAASNTWMMRGDMPGGTRNSVTLATVPNAAGQSILYVMGGRTTTGASLGRVQAYNVGANSWMYRRDMSSPVYNTNGAGVIGGKIYVSGGRLAKDNKDSRAYLQMYDPATNMWTRKHDMPWETAGGLTGVIDNQLYVLTCGQQEFCTYDGNLAVYRYDPAMDQWSTVAMSPFNSGPPVGAAINRKLYFVSDRGPDLFNQTTQLTEYDPATNQWTVKMPPPKPRSGGTAVALGAKLYLIGGFEKQSDGRVVQVRAVRVYNPSTDSWSTRSMLPNMREGSAARVVRDGKARIEFVGGAAPGNNLQYTP